jgi:hypothetical protein
MMSTVHGDLWYEFVFSRRDFVLLEPQICRIVYFSTARFQRSFLIAPSCESVLEPIGIITGADDPILRYAELVGSSYG